MQWRLLMAGLALAGLVLTGCTRSSTGGAETAGGGPGATGPAATAPTAPAPAADGSDLDPNTPVSSDGSMGPVGGAGGSTGGAGGGSPANPGGGSPANPGSGGAAAQPEPPPADGPAIEVTVPAAQAQVEGEIIHLEGRARVFEGVFMAQVEDGHNVLGEMVIQTGVGAPEWGNFSADLTLEQKPTNRTLMLILYIESPKDGSRQELALIPLQYTGPCADNGC